MTQTEEQVLTVSSAADVDMKRVDRVETAFASVNDLAGALRRAAAAHGEHEKRINRHDDNWPDWYAAYMVAEQTGGKVPQ